MPLHLGPPLAAWGERADATDTGILVGIARSANLSQEHRDFLECVAWRLALLLDHHNGNGREVREGLLRFMEPPQGAPR